MINYTKKGVLGVFLISLMIGCKSTNPKKDIETEDKIENVDSFTKNISPEEFEKIVSSDNVITLDVRTPKEVVQGKIENSSVIDFYSEDFVSKIKFMDKSKAIAVYCKSGGRSAKAVEVLQKNGFDKIYELKGGLMAWESKGLPIVKSEVNMDENIQTMTLKDFKKLLETDKPVLVNFHTVWCAPCRNMAPIVDEIEKEYKDKAVVVRVDLDKSKAVVSAFKIETVPVFLLFKKGSKKWEKKGVLTKSEIKAQIDKEI